MSIIELDERPSGDRMTFGIFAVLGAKRVATESCLLCNVITVITDNSYNMVTWKVRNSETFPINKLECVLTGF